MDRHILHMDQDTYFVSVERLQNPKLIGVPVIVGSLSDRGVVASCSYEARLFGVHSAMPSKLARRLCPQAVWVRGDMDMYSKYSSMITDIIREAAPIVEKTSIDEHYLDLSGMDRYFGCLQWAKELRQKIIKETGLPISFGLSVNKTVSKVATGIAKPNNGLDVSIGAERQFLAPLSIRKIPGLGEKTYLVLRNLGIQKISTLQQMPVKVMEHAIGKNGISIWQKANGIDDSLVIPYSEKKSISKEDTFETDTTDMELLKKTIVRMADALAFELRRDGRLASVVVVKIRYSNFDTHDMQATVPHTASDTALTATALELFRKLYSRRMLIRLVGVKFTGLVHGSYQINLFNDTIRDINLCQAMDSIRLRFGTDSVMKAIIL